jgi:methyl-accepting chemotaxis protein
MLEILNNWRMPRKMLLSFTSIGVVIAALCALSVYANQRIARFGEEHVARSLPAVQTMAEILGNLREYRILVYSHLEAANATEMASFEGRAEQARTELDADLAKFGELAGAGLAPDVARLKDDVAKLNAVNEQAITLSRARRIDAGLKLIKNEGRDASHQALGDAKTLMGTIVAQAESAGAETNRFTRFMGWTLLVVGLLSVGYLAAAWWVCVVTIARPMTELSDATTRLAEGGQAVVPHRSRADELGEIAKAVEHFRVAAIARQAQEREAAEDQRLVTDTLAESLSAVAQGDLTAEVRNDFPAAMQALKANFNEALARLREMIGAVSESTQGIRTGSDEIAQAAEDLARRTESNAASLEETSAALVQIDDRLKASAKAAGQTVARADQAIATVGSGRSIADEAVGAMSRVAESAKGIDSVIEGLDKIAFQTRVLAMNAAVEAGRAGEAGRGFAVVADLVSTLAMRSEEEAKRAREQLTVTQTDIGAAVDAVTKVDGALANISNDVGEVHTLLGSMAADNQAQSSAVTQISAAISSMDQATQQNAAMVEETSAAARNLTSEVTSLSAQAALFRVGAGHAAPARRAAPPAPKTGYVSPVQPLPMPKAAPAIATAGADDWSDF